jgi:hypothetical protein
MATTTRTGGGVAGTMVLQRTMSIAVGAEP